MKKKTNFDRYLEEQLLDKGFEERFRKAGEAWDVAMKLAASRKSKRWSQKERANAKMRVQETSKWNEENS